MEREGERLREKERDGEREGERETETEREKTEKRLFYEREGGRWWAHIFVHSLNVLLHF